MSSVAALFFVIFILYVLGMAFSLDCKENTFRLQIFYTKHVYYYKSTLYYYKSPVYYYNSLPLRKYKIYYRNYRIAISS